MHNLPWLVADIGGTNTRLGRILCVDGPVVDLVRFDTPRSGDLGGALKPYLDAFVVGRPRSAALALAGPIVGCHVQLTNSGAHLSADTVKQLFGLESFLLVNDLEAVAAALPRMSASQVRPLGPDLPPITVGTRLVLGCGTGCGVGTAVWDGVHWHVIASEGGHLPFPALSARDRRWREHIVRTLPTEADERVTYDRVLCGSGFYALAETIAAEMNASVQPTPEAVAQSARAGSDPASVLTAQHFAHWVASFAGDLAQVFLASGGVYLAGSLLESLEPFLASPEVRAAFTRKWPHDALLAKIPMCLITDPQSPLIGLGEILRRPMISRQSYSPAVVA
jgi:glucokinase